MNSQTEHSIFVFLGPTLKKEEALKYLPQAIYLPPVRCGDVLRILRFNPDKIVIIDGFFERTAAVWHKELLYALEKGIEIYGSSSMGALRAAELADYGMVGVGDIYNNYRNGILTDDDDVAILHEPAENAFRPSTDAMVNISATLQSAVANKVIDQSLAKLILETAKESHYQNRTIEKVCHAVLKKSINNYPIECFLEWSRNNYVDQKQNDAIKLLKIISSQESKSRIVGNHKVAASIFFKTLHRRIFCQPFPYFSDWLPLPEKAASLSRLLDDEYKLAQRLALLLSIIYASDDQSKMDRNNDTPFGFSAEMSERDWIDKSDLTLDEYDKFLRRLVIVNNAISSLREESNIVISRDDVFLSFMRITGEYLNCKELGNDVIKVFKNSCPEKYRLYELISNLWCGVEQKAFSLNWHPDIENVQLFSDRFRRQNKLTTAVATRQWLVANDLDQEGYNALMSFAARFNYLVIANNNDILQPNNKLEDNPWFLDALRLSGLYLKAKRIMSDPAYRQEIIQELHKKLSTMNDSYAYSIGFELGKSELLSFSISNPL